MTIKLTKNHCVSEVLQNSVSAGAVVAAHCISKPNSTEQQLNQTTKTNAKSKISCELNDMLQFVNSFWHQSCLLDRSAKIRTPDVQVASNVSSTSALYMNGNKKILYLPFGLSLVFPSLYVITAQDCSVIELRKENFSGLKQLSHLGLEGNMIETIESETFRGLDSLVVINLSKIDKEVQFSCSNLIFFRNEFHQIHRH